MNCVTGENSSIGLLAGGNESCLSVALLENLLVLAISNNGKETSAFTTIVEASQRDARTVPKTTKLLFGSAGGFIIVEARQRDIETVPEKLLFGPTTSASSSTLLFGSSATTAGGSTTMATRSNIDIGTNQEDSEAILQEKTLDAKYPKNTLFGNTSPLIFTRKSSLGPSTIFGLS